MPATAQRQISAYYKTQQGYRETVKTAQEQSYLSFRPRRSSPHIVLVRALRANVLRAASRAPAGEPLPDPLAQAHCLPWSRIVVCYRQYRYTGGAGNNTHNALSGGPCIVFNTVLFLYLFCIGIMYCATLITRNVPAISRTYMS